MDFRFVILFLMLAAVAGFIAKRIISRDDPATIGEIVSEIIPLLNDPAALGRRLAGDLRKLRIHGAGTITDITAAPGVEIIRVRERMVVETEAGPGERDVVFDLSFMHPDTLDDAAPGLYVEFTGILTGIIAQGGTPVLAVDPGEILFIGDGPPDADDSDDEELPGAGGELLP